MKKLIITLSILIWFILIFYYENKNIIMSNTLNNNAIINYNTWSYQESVDIFSWALLFNNDYVINYNLGNSLFKTDNETINIENKIKLYNEVLEIYSGSLAIKYSQDTQGNYEYVEDKLNQLLNPEEEKQNKEKGNINGITRYPIHEIFPPLPIRLVTWNSFHNFISTKIRDYNCANGR